MDNATSEALLKIAKILSIFEQDLKMLFQTTEILLEDYAKRLTATTETAP